MGEILGGILSSILSSVMTLLILANFFTGDQVTSFHQAVREAGRAGANEPAPAFNSSTGGTSLQTDDLMVDQVYLTFLNAFKAAVPNGQVVSLQYWPNSPDNPEDVKLTATVTIPRFMFNALNLVGGPSFSPSDQKTFTVYYYREWDYNNAISQGAINPSSDGVAQSN